MAMPFLEDAVFNVYEAMRGTLLPVTAVPFTSGIALALLSILILVCGFVHRRFWCRNLCPLGALMGLFSAGRRYRRVVDDNCTSCGLCRKRCRMDAIGEDFTSTDHVECISCMDCKAVCPVDAVHFTFPKKAKITRPDFSRRQFLAAGASGAVAAGIFGIGYIDPGISTTVVRPPGAHEENAFLDRCIRCGECVRICSTAGAGLQLAGLESGLKGLWTPLIRAKTGYCEYNCNLCGMVCPTGAIQKLSLEEKQEIKMGTAHFDKTNCIPWYYGENCLVCEEHCPLPEKAIKFQEAHVTTISGEHTDVLLPYVDEALCIGCGICVNRCPVEGSRGIFITSAGEIRL
jgi:ferredoxin